MTEPIGAFTNQDLLTSVALEIGCPYYGATGVGVAMPPVTSEHDFDQVKKIVSRGIKRFIDLSPAPGWNWRKRLTSIVFLTTLTKATAFTTAPAAGDILTQATSGATLVVRSVSTDKLTILGSQTSDAVFTTGYTVSSNNTGATMSPATFTPSAVSSGTTVISSDPARFLMPQDFSGVPAGPVAYAKNTAHNTRIEIVHDGSIRRDRSCCVQTSYPSRIAFLPYGVRRYELLVDPSPVAADIIEIPYLAHFDSLLAEGGIATAGAATTLTDTALTTRGYFPDDYFNGWVITVLGGTGKGQTATITDWDLSDSKFTFTALSGGSTPDATTVYIVQPASPYHPAGAAFDTAVLGACLAQAVLDTGKDDTSGRVAEFFKVLLPAARETDREIAGRSRRLGKMSDGPRDYRERTWNTVTYQ